MVHLGSLLLLEKVAASAQYHPIAINLWLALNGGMIPPDNHASSHPVNRKGHHQRANVNVNVPYAQGVYKGCVRKGVMRQQCCASNMTATKHYTFEYLRLAVLLAPRAGVVTLLGTRSWRHIIQPLPLSSTKVPLAKW